MIAAINGSVCVIEVIPVIFVTCPVNLWRARDFGEE